MLDVNIGAITYLNALPLTRYLAQCLPDATIQYDLPSRLADRIRRQEFDVALIPSIEVMRIPQVGVISEACIACDGEVRSVMLASRVPVHKIRTLAVDEGSRTSECLARVILKQVGGVVPQRIAFPLGISLDTVQQDAAVIIGDRAIGVKPTEQFPYVWDLGQQWKELTGLPFVFGVWVVRSNSEKLSAELTQELTARLSKARDLGVANIESIVAEVHARHGLTYDDCLQYLTQCLEYQMDEQQHRALGEFYMLAGELPDIDF